VGNETKNYKFPKPSEDDFYDISEYNKAMDILDETLTEMSDRKLDSNGNASDVVTEFSQEILRNNIESGEKLSVSHGKVQKWFSEMKNIAFSGLASDVAQDAAHRYVTDTEKNGWNAKVSASGGDISGTKIGSLETITSEFPVPAEGETPKVFLGKVKKFIQDFNDFKAGVITVGKLVNNGQTSAAGYALDARYGKTLYDLYTQLNSDKANSNHNHDDRYYTESEITNLLESLLKRIVFFSDVLNASAGDKTQNVLLGDTSNYLLVVNKGSSNSETGLYLLTARNGSIYQTAIKTVTGITINTYQLVLGITYSYPNVGVATVTKLGY
jgi:hypothetical protein